MSTLPEAVYRASVTSNKLQWPFYRYRTILRFVWNGTARPILRKHKARDLTLISNDITKLQTSTQNWSRHKNTHADQCNRTEGPAISPYLYGRLVCDKGATNIQQGTNSLFHNGVGKMEVTSKRMTLDKDGWPTGTREGDHHES